LLIFFFLKDRWSLGYGVQLGPWGKDDKSMT